MLGIKYACSMKKMMMIKKIENRKYISIIEENNLEQKRKYKK
jgi:hypothetical protein